MAVSRQDGEKLSNRGRAEGRKVDAVKAKAIATGKEVGIGKRTIERSLAKASGKKLKRPRRTDAKGERDRFLHFVSNLGVQNDAEVPKLSDAALALLATEERAEAVTVMENAIARLQKVLDRLRLMDRAG
jgi:hypothetical protein